MGIFNKRKNDSEPWEAPKHMTPSDYHINESRKREIAIDYINSLSKKDLELFMEGARLIWEGYGILNKVKSPAEKREEKEAKEEEVFDLTSDDDGIGFLDLDDTNVNK